MKASQLLIKTKWLLDEPDKWSPEFYSFGGKHDLDGALAETDGIEVHKEWMKIGGSRAYGEARNYLVDAEKEIWTHLVPDSALDNLMDYSLDCWEGVTHQDITNLLDKAIENAKADGR